MQAKELFSYIDQIGVLTIDGEKTIANMKKIFGLEPNRFGKALPGTNSGYYRGQPRNAEIDMIFYDFDNCHIELIYPRAGKSIHDEYLEKHGTGIYHLRFDVPDFEAAIKHFKDRGYEPAMGGESSNTKGAKWCYFDFFDELGYYVELINLREIGVTPKPYVNPNPAENVFTHIDQISVLTTDKEKTIANMKKIFDLEPTRQSVSLKDDPTGYYRGKPRHAVVEMVFYDFENMHIELIHPVEGACIHWEYLEKKGTGLFHYRFDVENYEKALANLKKAGYEPATGGESAVKKGVKWCYYDFFDDLGYFVEVINNKEMADK